MGLYLGSSQKKMRLSNMILRLDHYTSTTSPFKGVLLKSSDDYILKDLNESYLTAKDGD